MHSLITSYLLQSKECILPGIGVLKIIHTPASTDTAGNRILPPFEGIIFKKEDHSKSPGLAKYISYKKNIDESEAENALDNFCKEWKEKINAGEKLELETVGSIQKNADGEIIFEKEKGIEFFKPVSVEGIYQRSAEPVFIEKEEQEEQKEQLPQINEFKDEEEVVVERSYWGLWALILLAVGLVVIFYHFKDHKVNGTSIGNQHKYSVDSAGPTYRSK